MPQKPPDPKFFPDHGNPLSLVGSTTGEPKPPMGFARGRKAGAPRPTQTPAAKSEADAIKEAFERVINCAHIVNECRPPCTPCILGAISGAMLAERDLRAKEANATFQERFLRMLGIEPLAEKACEGCGGLGRRNYANGPGWRGGAGGSAITLDLCDRCWGSGVAERPFADLSRVRSGVVSMISLMRKAWDAAGRVVQEAQHHRGGGRLPAALVEKIEALEKATPPEALQTARAP